METHGGSIQVFSAGAGKGATFTVEMAVSHSPTMAKISGSNPPAAMAPRRNRILLVEDHADTATSLAWLLSNAGYKVTTALTVASALEAAAQQPFDVMASDLGLPDRSGYELMQEVRRLYGLKGIALSGYGMPDDIGRARAAGFSDHIVKPVKIVQLKATLQRLLTDEPVPEPHGVDEAAFVTRI
jgi:CheY-like chemotaxis protein